MVNKSRKRAKKQQKAKQQSKPPSPITSPLKVLVSTPASDPSDPNQFVKRAVDAFNENIRNNVDDLGRLNLDGYLTSSGVEAMEIDTFEMENDPSIFLLIPEQEPTSDVPQVVHNTTPESIPDKNEADPQTQQQLETESSGNSTDTANDDPELEFEDSKQTTPEKPDTNTLLFLPSPDPTPPLKPTKTYSAQYNLKKRPIKVNKRPLDPNPSPPPPPPPPLDPRYITLGTNTDPTTTTRQPTSLPDPTFQSLYQNLSNIKKQTNILNSTSVPSLIQTPSDNQQQRQTLSFNSRCAHQSCNKKPSVICRGCNMLVFCTEKHKKIANNSHIQFCNGFRITDRKPFGKHAIANKDVKKSGNVLTDEPVVILPLNPSMTSRTFPPTYCVKCFKDTSSDRIKKTTKTCDNGCKLPVCDRTCALSFCSLNHEYNRIPPHTETECKLITSSLNRGSSKRHILILDQSFLGLLRTLRSTTITDSTTTFLEVTKTIPLSNNIKKSSINFESKLRAIRTLFNIDESTADDKHLYQLDQALLKYGRNITNDSIQWKDSSDGRAFNTFFRCIYPKLSLMIHSCLPNNLLIISNNLNLEMTPVVDLKKGEVLSISYDDRCLTLPTTPRRTFLQSQFSFSCKCKRCVSPSELSTYFSSYPCSYCPSGYLTPLNPLDPYSDWTCETCKHTKVPYLRIIDSDYNFEAELEETMNLNNPQALLNVMNELVSNKYLHWHHHLIFNASLRLFEMLWEELCSGDKKSMNDYSRKLGQQYLNPALSIIHITSIFIPNSYTTNHVLPLRLASIITLRSLTTSLTKKETSINKINNFIKSTYLRSIDRTPLYKRHPNTDQSPQNSERNIKILELKILDSLKHQHLLLDGTSKFKQGSDIIDMWEAKSKEEEYINLQKTKDVKRGVLGFPWDIDV